MSAHKPGLFRLVLHALGGGRKRPRNTSSVTRTYYVTSGHFAPGQLRRIGIEALIRHSR